jgi:hypothetical protein
VAICHIAKLHPYRRALVQDDLDHYFKSRNVPAPTATAIRIDDFKLETPSSLKSESPEVAEVMLNIEMPGSIAPRAQIRVYFVTDKGWFAALKQAEADHVLVLLIAQTIFPTEDREPHAFRVSARQRRIWRFAPGRKLDHRDAQKSGG